MTEKTVVGPARFDPPFGADLTRPVINQIERDGWTFTTYVREPESPRNFVVVVHEGEREIASTYADTKWGARRAARKLKRRAERRRAMTGEMGRLK